MNWLRPHHTRPEYRRKASDRCAARRYWLTRGISVLLICSSSRPLFTMYQPIKPCHRHWEIIRGVCVSVGGEALLYYCHCVHEMVVKIDTGRSGSMPLAFGLGKQYRPRAHFFPERPTQIRLIKYFCSWFLFFCWHNREGKCTFLSSFCFCCSVIDHRCCQTVVRTKNSDTWHAFESRN